jgi:hypothetical protein
VTGDRQIIRMRRRRLHKGRLPQKDGFSQKGGTGCRGLPATRVAQQEAAVVDTPPRHNFPLAASDRELCDLSIVMACDQSPF